MVNLSTPRQTALVGVAAHKRVADQRIEEAKKAQKRMADEAKKAVLKSVLEALDLGVPQSRIAIDGLGYNQTNGIRSYFGLPMAGNLYEELKKKYNTIGRTEAEIEFDLAEVALPQVATVLYDTGTLNSGAPLWIMERPDGTKFRFTDASREFGEMVWSSRPDGSVLTEEEIALLTEHLPENNRRNWSFDPRKPYRVG